MIPQKKMTESVEKILEMGAQTHQEHKREVGKDLPQAKMDPQRVTRLFQTVTVQDDPCPR